MLLKADAKCGSRATARRYSLRASLTRPTACAVVCVTMRVHMYMYGRYWLCRFDLCVCSHAYIGLYM